MLNKNGERELAYIVHIDNIIPIEGADRVEQAIVGGWHIMVRKGQFQIGDLAIYFEIDSKVPEKPEFEFLAAKHYKIKTQKYFKGTVISQGLLMSAEDFGWENTTTDQFDGNTPIIKRPDGSYLIEGDFLTKELGVTYAEAEDNKRKANSADKYKKMAQRRPNIFKKKWAQWMMRRNWGKKVMFFFFGKKKDKKSEWPSHIASKTDVERIQNMIWVLQNKNPFVATEKIDGSSMSVMAEYGKFNKINKYVCSRNVVFENPEQDCYYDTNIYFEAYEKYHLGEKIEQMLKDLNLPNIAIQMEVYGYGVQKRNYSMSNGERKIAVFHILSNNVKMPMEKVVELCEKYDLPHVPIIDNNYILPDTIEELQAYVESASSAIDGLEKEGIVSYDKETGTQYFTFVSPSFLMKYHG